MRQDTTPPVLCTFFLLLLLPAGQSEDLAAAAHCEEGEVSAEPRDRSASTFAPSRPSRLLDGSADLPTSCPSLSDWDVRRFVNTGIRRNLILGHYFPARRAASYPTVY